MSRSKVYDIYMDPNYGATGTQRHFTNQIKHYSRPIIASNGNNYIDQNTQYQGIHSLPTDSGLAKLKVKELETAVCVCVYNEGQVALINTLTGIYKNLQRLRQQSPMGLKEQLAVFIIQDGILKCNDNIVQFLQPYEPIPHRSQIATRQTIIRHQYKSVQNNKQQLNPSAGDQIPWSIPKKTSLLYQIEWSPNGQTTNLRLKVFFAFKHLNGKKLSSHAWFFEGFCRYLNPELCILLDVGTVPQEDGIVNLIKALKSDQKIGGVSGFMNIDAELEAEEGGGQKKARQDGYQEIQNQLSEVAINTNPTPEQSLRRLNAQANIQTQEKKKNWFLRCFFSIEKAQASEYIMAHFLDKNFESSLKFLHVLPGAWSGYRLAALQTGQIYVKDILQDKYFRTLINPNQKLQAYQMMKTSNMYLAEDRILSLAIYCQRNKQYYLKYVPNAKAKTDPMKNEVDLCLQRRRWINSSLYAFEYVRANYEYDMANSNHSAWEKVLMHFNIFMSSVSFFNSSLIPCFFLFILFSTIRNNGFAESDLSKSITLGISLAASFIYIIVIFVAILGSMNGNIWIRDIYVRQPSGQVKMKQLPNKKKQPQKLDGKLKINGPANIITIILAVYNFLWFLAVAAFTVFLVKRGIEAFVQNKPIPATSIISLLFLILNIGCYLILLLVHLPTHPREVWELIVGGISSLYYLSLYTHTMMIFSICNVDDTSWGTKGATGSHGGDGKDDDKGFLKQKSYFVGWWILKNAAICFIFFMIDLNVPGGWVTLIIACYSSVIYIIKCIIAIGNQVAFLFERCCSCCKKKPSTL